MTRGGGRVLPLALTALLLAACSGDPQAGGGANQSSGTRPAGDSDFPEPTREARPGDGEPHPDGRIAFGRITRQEPGSGQVVALFAIDPDGSDEVQLTEGESAFPSWSPDGTRLAYAAGLEDGSWQIATMAADGTDIRLLTSGPGIRNVPTWSPDGTWLAYHYGSLPTWDPAFRTQLWRMDADGSNQELLGNPDTYDVEPRISPDGRSVVFQRLTDGGTTSTLTVRDLATGKETGYPAAGVLADHPAWSPDGRWIVYNLAAIPERQNQVEKVPVDGSSGPVVMFRGTTDVGGFKPVYSPDGSQILFGCWGLEGGTSDAACLMRADGSNVRVLVDLEVAAENHFSWGTVPR